MSTQPNPAPAMETDQPTPLVGATPSTTGQSPVQPQQPTIVKPVKRTGLAGIVDEMRDAIAGPAPGRVYEDPDGNQYIQHTDSSGSKWARIASQAIRGAAAGAAVGRGPGGAERGAAAGVEAGDKAAQMAQEREKNLSEEVKQANLDRFNRIKLQHDQVAQDFELSRLKVKAAQDDITFAQAQNDRLAKLVDEGKAWDRGVYADEADLARVKEQDQNFWKNVYGNNYVAVPEIGPDGTRQGVHLYQTAPGEGSTPKPNQIFHTFEPPMKPGDQPKIVEHTSSSPMSDNQVHAYDLAAYTQNQQWQINQKDQELKAAQIEETKASAKKQTAEAGKATEETKQLKTASGSADPFGFVSTIPPKEYDKRYDAFGKNYVESLTKSDQQLAQFAGINSDIDKNGNMTGAESVVGLFNAIGISASPLKGSGFRVNNNTIGEHEEARGLGQSLYQKLLRLKSGDVITPQQLKDYSTLAERAREYQYYSAIDEARRQGLPVDFLPKGNGKVIDPSTARMYMRAADNDPQKARSAAASSGWTIGPGSSSAGSL